MDSKLKTQFDQITTRTYAGQAKWFLNGFWKEHEKDAEAIWEMVNNAIKIDHRKGKEGNELDEFEAHRFLEGLGETLTVKDMRDKLREIDVDFNKRMALIEYLIFKYNKGVVQVISAPQGGGGKNAARLEAAQKLVDAASIALDEMSRLLEAEKQALAYQKIAEADAVRAEEESKAALAELTAQEMAFANAKADLKRKSENESSGQVSRNRAKNELEQLLAKDPLPLTRAKLNQEAAVRKSERARKAAEEARLKQEQSARAAAAQVEEANAKFQAAVDELEEIKKIPDQSYGDIWWMERELAEKKKYLPRSRQ
jgi:flagellar biosynthesis GTPase FlhF